MADVSAIPHRTAHAMCPVNGIRDLVEWRTGRNWSSEFVWGLGQGGGFAYLRINVADPPRQVYWGAASSRQHEYLAGLLGAQYTMIEGRSFRFAWERACAALQAGTPPVLGPLDMFYLPYYPAIYQKRHIPIHYLLLVGASDAAATFLDTDKDDPQVLALIDLRAAWDVSVPGLGKRNRLAVLNIPAEIPPDGALICRSIADQCQAMLRPPISMLGVPAMEKLAAEIAGWPEELGAERAAASLRQVREYLCSPPDVEGDHLTAGRDRYIAFLEQAGPVAELDFGSAIRCLQETIEQVPEMAAAVEARHLGDAAAAMRQIAASEARAFGALEQALSEG